MHKSYFFKKWATYLPNKIRLAIDIGIICIALWLSKVKVSILSTKLGVSNVSLAILFIQKNIQLIVCKVSF